MRGIREISGLCFWLDNGKSRVIEEVLKNNRPQSRDREMLLREINSIPAPKPVSRARKAPSQAGHSSY